METVLCRRAQPLTQSNLFISNEVTLTSLPAKTEDNIISKLKKLPDITFDLVKSEPVFKTPKIPKPINNNIKKIITPVVPEKKILSKRHDDKNINRKISVDLTNIDFKNTSKKQNKEIVNIIPLKRKKTNQTIPNNQKSTPSRYAYSEKENRQRTSSPNKFLKNIRLKSANSKSVKSAKKITKNNSIASLGVNSDSIVNNTTIKTHAFSALKSNDEDYTLMDLSTTGQVNIVSASRRDFIDVRNSEYDGFVLGINKSPEYNYGMQEFISCFSNLQTNYPICTNKSEKQSDFMSLSYSEKENVSLDCCENEQMTVNNKTKGLEYEINKLGNERHFSSGNVFKKSQLQINEIHDTMDISDDYFLQGMKMYFRENLMEEVPLYENKLIDSSKLIPQILPNTEQESSNVKLNENINCTKRWQPQNDLRKKQKTDE